MVGKELPVPEGTRCELCGMMAVKAVKDDLGVVHYYCEHHIPAETAKLDVRHDHIAHQAHADRGKAASTLGKEEQAHDEHAGHTVEMFRDRFWLSFVLTIPVVLYSELPERFFGFTMPVFPGSAYLSLVLGSIIFFYGGLVFLKGAVRELQHHLPGMMTLIALAITAAYIFSVAATFLDLGHTLFWELTTLITVMLFGHWMEMRSVGRAQGALQELAKLLPDKAERIKGGGTEIVPVSELKVGDLVLVRPGAKVPADSVVAEGQSSLNESMITGESRPVDKKRGMEVIAGTVNGEGSLKITVTKVGENTALAGIMRLVAQAMASRSRAQILADRAAFYLTIIAVITGSATLIGWVSSGAGWPFAIQRMVTVLVIACPHALGLAIPLVTSISTTLSARNGLLVRERMTLEAARNIDVVLFDKTGTLTKGEQGMTDIWTVEKNDRDRVLALAASVEAQSEHVIAKGIVNKAKQEKLSIVGSTQFKAIPGRGARGVIDGQSIEVGGPKLLEERKLSLPDALKKTTDQAGKQGKTVVFVIVEGTLVGAIALADLIRDESREAVKALKEMGVRVAMLTGDSEDVAKWVARELEITEYFAQVLPAHKAEKVKELQKDGSRVAMVGDGVNDAPALTQADIGIAIGAGTDVAIESAGIILVKNDPHDVVKIIELSRATYRKMLQNLGWATGYNIIAIPLAAGVLASQGILLPPAIGALFMSGSTVIVAANAQLLRRLQLSQGKKM